MQRPTKPESTSHGEETGTCNYPGEPIFGNGKGKFVKPCPGDKWDFFGHDLDPKRLPFHTSNRGSGHAEARADPWANEGRTIPCTEDGDPLPESSHQTQVHQNQPVEHESQENELHDSPTSLNRDDNDLEAASLMRQYIDLGESPARTDDNPTENTEVANSEHD